MSFDFTDKRTSLLIDEQVPQFLHDYGPKFIKFIEKYYEWLSTSKIEVEVEYLDDTVPDIVFELENLKEDKKPQIKGLHTNSLSRILSYTKIDRYNYSFQVKHYSGKIEKPFPLTNPNSPNRYSKRNEISKGYSVNEFLEFLNDPYIEMTEKDDQQNQKVKMKVKSFIQQSEMSSKNMWNSFDVDLTLNSLVDRYMKEYLQSFPLTYPNENEILDINDKVSRNYTVEDFKKFLIKHSREFYQSKGTEDSFRYLFRTVFNKEIDIYYPGEDVIKASDNIFVATNTIYMRPVSNFSNIDVESKYVYGESSGSSAVIENYFLKNSLNREYVELLVNSETISGSFLPNENLRVLDDDGNLVNIGNALLSIKGVEVLETSTEKFSIGERIFLDKKLNRIDVRQIPVNMKNEYIELEVQKLESGEIKDLIIDYPGNEYSVGDEILFDNTDCYLKSKPHRFLKAYVSKVCYLGSIESIKVTVQGRGYINTPKILSIGGRVYDETDFRNAKISFLTEKLGKAKSVKIVNTGFDYEISNSEIDLNGDSNLDLKLIFGVETKDQEKFLNNSGFLSDVKMLQDSKYFQRFSYVIKSDIFPGEYRDLVKRLVHPAGLRFFGEYYISNEVNVGMKLNQRKINEIELNDRNYIGRYSNVVLDEWSLYENFDNVEIRQNDLIPTVIESKNEFKYLNLAGKVNLTKDSNIITGVGTNFLTSLQLQEKVLTVDVKPTDNGNIYLVDGVEQSKLTLNVGSTYIFDWSKSPTHPVRFSTTPDGTHNGGIEYLSGVTKEDSLFRTKITIQSGSPDLYYYCQFHSGMGSSIGITDNIFERDNFVMIKDQGFFVNSINSDTEIVVNQNSNKDVNSENILLRQKN